MQRVDLNCDMGEGCGNDAELMKYVSSVNIACGFHAGDVSTMRETVELAVENGVAIGAHPSFPDREGFGRRPMSLPLVEVFDIVVYQIDLLNRICNELGQRLHHVKPHGALYNQAAKDRALARAIGGAVKKVDDNLVVYGLSGSFLISEIGALGLRTASEVFADRTYQPDGSLTPRTELDSLITDTDRAVAQVLELVNSQSVTAGAGEDIPLRADTICIHGDGEHSVEFAITLRKKLIENGVVVCSV